MLGNMGNVVKLSLNVPTLDYLHYFLKVASVVSSPPPLFQIAVCLLPYITFVSPKILRNLFPLQFYMK